MRTILITGGTGFAASHLLEALLQQGETEIHLTAYKDAGDFARRLVPAENVHQLDLSDYAATATLMQQVLPDQIYHLASLANVGSSFVNHQFIMDIHTHLQLNLLEAMRNFVPKARLLHVSTALVYRSSNRALNEQAALGPDNPYALSKLTQDMMAYTFHRSAKLDVVRVRPFNHIGERQTTGFVVADLAKGIVEIEKGLSGELKVGNLDPIRDFSDVKDVVQAYILLMHQGQNGEVYNVGSGQGHSIQQILQLLLSQAKIKIPISIDISKIRPVDLNYLVCDNEKITDLGWRATHQLSDTLARILEYWRKTL